MSKTTILALLALTLTACDNRPVEYTRIEGAMLGTSYHVTAQIKGVNRGALVAKIEALDERMKREMSLFDTESQLSRINRGECDSLTVWLAQNIRLADSISRLSGGIYDITVAPLVKAWGFARKSEREEEVKVDSLLQFVGYEGIKIEGDRIIKRDWRMQIDLNSIAKGFAVDRMAEIVEQCGAENYIVEIGGELRLRGVNPSGDAWRVGVESPIDGNMSEGEMLQRRIAIAPDSPLKAMATSGNYRRFYISDEGEKIVHTIDPKSGYSRESKLLSATVLAPTCAEADGYATMLMAAGEAEAVELSKGIANCEVYLIFDNGEGGYREYISSEMQSMIIK